MGCCQAGQEEAKVTTIPPPAEGQAMQVRLKKQGMFDSDFDVLDLTKDGAQWMLVDAVGGWGTGGMKYYLKHRMEGQEKSTVLGFCEIPYAQHGDGFKMKGKQETEVEFDSASDGDWSDDDFGDVDIDDVDVLEIEKKFKGKWKLEKECILYDGDPNPPEGSGAPGKKIGKLKVKAKGKYKCKAELKIARFTDAEGHEQERRDVDYDEKFKVKKFHYKFEIHDTPFHLDLQKVGSSWIGPKMEWKATNDAGTDLFSVVGRGRDCTVQTCPGSDPASSLLAAFAVAVKFDPDEIHSIGMGFARRYRPHF